ncbi:MAG: hypothetical protein HUJ69_08740 [Lachnospiraceae bacterium]|nr:hypothetical protein [Lachnospiraceae bacterium]
MFSREEYYKLFNSRSEERYRELRIQLENHVSELGNPTDKGFRDKMLRFSKKMGDYLVKLCQLEEGRTEDYLRAASLKDLMDDQNNLYGWILKGNYVKEVVSTTYMNTQVRDIGPALAMFAAEFVNGAEDAIYHRRFILADRIELYFEMHKRLTRGQIRAEALVGLLRDFHNTIDRKAMEIRILQNYSPLDETNTQILREANLREPYYLYEYGVPVGGAERGLQKFLTTYDEDHLQKTAEKIVEAFTGSIPQSGLNSRGYRHYNGFDRSFEGKDERNDVYEPDMVRNLVALDYPAGSEMLARQILLALDKKGMRGFVRHISTTAVSQAYLRDHQGDAIRCMDRGFLQRHPELTEKLAADNRCMLKSFAGAISLKLPEELSYTMLQEELKNARTLVGRVQRPTGRYSVGAAEEKRKNYREYLLEEETILRRAGGMESCALVNVTLPAFEEAPTSPETYPETYGETLRKYLDLAVMEHHSERSLKALTDALDKGSFLYLQGGKAKNQQGEETVNETDLLIALPMVKDPSRETLVQTCHVGGDLPAGHVYTLPQKAETNGLLHLPRTVIDGVEYKDLRLNFEDGVLKSCSAAGFEDPEEEGKFLREKLLHGVSETELKELALGVYSGSWQASYGSEDMKTLPEAMRSSYGISLVLGESSMEREDFFRLNPQNRKLMALLPEPEAEDADEPTAPSQGGTEKDPSGQKPAAANVDDKQQGDRQEASETAAEQSADRAAAHTALAQAAAGQTLKVETAAGVSQEAADKPAAAGEQTAEGENAAATETAAAEKNGTENTAPAEAAAAEQQAASHEQHRKRYSYPLRRRINLPYEMFGTVRIINENGTFSDIYRMGTFVLIGMDQLNMKAYKKN